MLLPLLYATLITGTVRYTEQLRLQTFELVVQILQQDPDDLNNGEDQGAKRQSSCVIPKQHNEVRKLQLLCHVSTQWPSGLMQDPAVQSENSKLSERFRTRI